MKKVGFFRSIHLKFVLIYMLLILIAMQVIGVYFVRQLEDTLLTNFKTSIKERVNLLAYNIEEEMAKERGKEDPLLEEDIKRVLKDFATGDITEVRVIEFGSMKILGTSAQNNQYVVGQRMNDFIVKRSLVTETEHSSILIDRGKRIWVVSTPIHAKEDISGSIYLVAKIENVFKQMQEINDIFMSGTAIALAITAILGILLAQTITRPISDMQKHALAMARGNFSRKVKVYGYDEIGQLALTFNSLTKKLQEAQATTEGERRKLASVLSNMTDGVIATDRRGRVIIINEPALEILNVSRETVLSEPIVSVLGIEGKYSFEDLLEETTESITLDFSTYSKPYILKANISVIQKETGFVNGLITVLHDITEQEKIDFERQEFVANVSHELRTPLTTMRSYLEALADGAWQDEEIAPNFLEVTRNETERMIRLVNDLLQLSKMDSKDYRIKKEWVEFVEFFNRIIDRFELAREQTIIFKRSITTENIFIEMDEDKLTQVLDNVISNALKYSPEGGQVSFQIEEQENRIVVSISDQGVGIPKSDINKIFERFYRVDKARTRKLGGTGLGLAIAKEVVKAHGGDIWATSIEGEGTTISFSLPYDRTYEDDWS